MQTIFIPEILPNDGFPFQIAAAFTGFKVFPPLIAFSKNTATPHLTLYEDHITYKVFRTKSAKYSDIEKVDAAAYLAKNLTLYFKNSIFRFTAQFNQREDLIELLKFLRSKSVQLSKNADNFISQR